jgi:hypothetical protein
MQYVRFRMRIFIVYIRFAHFDVVFTLLFVAQEPISAVRSGKNTPRRINGMPALDLYVVFILPLVPFFFRAIRFGVRVISF